MNRNFGLKEKQIDEIAIPSDGIEDKHILHSILSLYVFCYYIIQVSSQLV